ncbi:SDR family NAD(P)-dependent oxidoreductase [Nocardia aurantiaca]|uniref:SDR family NAD(P)-dependent oxidoreductase n=1 Tax=Nocardia aurantiaca TaxID=2675850 RepID=UPI002E2081AC
MSLDRYRALMAWVNEGRFGPWAPAIQSGIVRWLFEARSHRGRRPGRAAAQVTEIAGRRILITGGSSGIGRATALRLAGLGADVVVVARRSAELQELCDEIVRTGGRAAAIACDLTDEAAVAGLSERLIAEWGGVDVLINNAGRSIRRSVVETLGRHADELPENSRLLHDFERTMAVNYFGAIALTLRLLPTMLASGGGHIVNVGTAGVQIGTMPKFSAYGGSKAALVAFGRSLDTELSGRGITVTAVHYPLVQTPMIGGTENYRGLPALTPEEAAEWLVTAIRTRPVAVYPRFAGILRALGTLSPRWADRMVLAAA